ncbi:MAG: sodium:proton antiporter [Gemmatimonadaceae bacterium]
MSSEATFVILFSIATGVALAVRLLRIPYTVALVIVGITLGGFHVMDAPHLTKELLFAVFLPGLLFDAAFNLDAREFWSNRLTIGSLAVPGVVAGTVLTGLIVTAAIQAFGLVEGFGWRHGLVFGALVAATDPIAVVGLFRDLNAPHRLRVLVEGESLLNDGTSIVALTLILAFVAGASTSVVDVTRQFITIVGGGALVGAVLGFGLSRITARIDDAMIEITLTTIAAYGSFVIAEQFHFSGVIATVAAGLIFGNYGRRIGMSPSTQLSVQNFWEYIAFALNSVIFLLIGFDVGPGMLLASWKIIAIAFAAMLLARTALILTVTSILSRTDERIPFTWGLALTWSGLRGALSMVLALALSPQFPGRDLLVAMTFGVVIASILVQGLSMPLVLRRLGIVNVEESRFTYDLARARLHISSRLGREIDGMRHNHAAPPEVLDGIAEDVALRNETARDTLRLFHGERAELRQEATRAVVEHLLRVEKAELIERMREGVMRREIFEMLARDVDSRVMQLRSDKFEGLDELLKVMSHRDTVVTKEAAAAERESQVEAPSETKPTQ